MKYKKLTEGFEDQVDKKAYREAMEDFKNNPKVYTLDEVEYEIRSESILMSKSPKD